MATRSADIFTKCTENAERVRAARGAQVYVFYRTI
jgi:hypothetical protein